MKEHGGDLDRAVTKFGGKKSEWIDLSTGINPNFYPIDPIKNIDIHTLPSQDDIKNLIDVASKSYNTNGFLKVVSGAQAAINLLPYLISKGDVSIIEPTYNEYNQTFLNANWKVNIVQNLKKMEGSTIAIICNPNNPDGKLYSNEDLLKISKNVEYLIIDESFMDQYPGKSLSHKLDDQTNILILRSFGKFFGLAGIRLGFLISNKEIDKKIQFLVGTWPISNVAINVASKALIDKVWIMNTISFLKEGSYFLDCLASEISWKVVGGTNLYRLYETPNADDAQYKLANFKIWSRRFTYSKKWIRLGIPKKKDFKKVSEIFKKIY
jgi:cobalamin biosynthetic protein CobC